MYVIKGQLTSNILLYIESVFRLMYNGTKQIFKNNNYLDDNLCVEISKGGGGLSMISSHYGLHMLQRDFPALSLVILQVQNWISS